MALSVSSTSLLPVTTSLSPGKQNIEAQTLNGADQHSLVSAGPAAIYHPSEPLDTALPASSAIDTWVGRDQSQDFPRLAAIAAGAQTVLKGVFQAFEAGLSAAQPDLVGAKYGFTVEADGRLKVLDAAGDLSRSTIERLTTLLNQSSALKSAAVAFRDASIDMVDADSPWTGSYMGYYSLTNENFANTIDLAPLLKPFGSMAPQATSDGLFINQLAYKGERATQETELAMYARRGMATGR
ncbi:hypothetical protein CQZ99_26490 [Pseudomonas poae]|uniref:Uncharacterized protein n=1 Tax=Pseudomonas poae TaxID=200451 RepID=A0A2S9E8I3_9PSED|nr:hypothetical protein CQZ97_08675 [Pseudomonas poae]PRC11169.1 hypothetical protein CQZ99_26490 [Pseudomonas poae]